MKKLIFKCIPVFAIIMLSFSTNAQDNMISVSGNLGWANPGGSGVTEEAEDLNLDGGLVYTLDALYHLDSKLGVGLNLTRAILAGAGGGDIDLFGMRVIGAKGYYQFRESGFTPYAALTLGMSQLLTPEVTITDSNGQSVTVPESNGSGFGIMPEFGLSFGKFYVGAQYLLPTSYSIDQVVDDKSVGIFNVVLGWRQPFSF